ncbi:MAG: response regulator [Acidimicrobiia bacterium]
MAGVAVMVVDDHRMVADGLATVLGADPDIDVVARAASGAEALTLAPRCRPDVVVVDLRLPDLGGVELVIRLRERRSDLPAVLISASFTHTAVNDAMAVGITAFASKLAPGEELIQAVRAAVAGIAYISSDVVPLLAESRRAGPGAILSDRECEVLQGLADRRSVAEIATALHLSQHTVRNHIRRAMSSLGVRRRLDAVVAAARAGFIELPQ